MIPEVHIFLLQNFCFGPVAIRMLDICPLQTIQWWDKVLLIDTYITARVTILFATLSAYCVNMCLFECGNLWTFAALSVCVCFCFCYNVSSCSVSYKEREERLKQNTAAAKNLSIISVSVCPVCVHACVHACACVCACVSVCVRRCVCL